MLSRNQLHHWRLFTWDSGRCLHLLFVCNFHAIKSFHCSEWKDVSDCKRASQSMYNRNWRDIKWEVFLRRHRRKGSNSLMKQQYNVTWKIRKNINNYMMRKLKLMASLATWAFCWLMFSQHLKSLLFQATFPLLFSKPIPQHGFLWPKYSTRDLALLNATQLDSFHQSHSEPSCSQVDWKSLLIWYSLWYLYYCFRKIHLIQEAKRFFNLNERNLLIKVSHVWGI